MAIESLVVFGLATLFLAVLAFYGTSPSNDEKKGNKDQNTFIVSGFVQEN